MTVSIFFSSARTSDESQPILCAFRRMFRSRLVTAQVQSLTKKWLSMVRCFVGDGRKKRRWNDRSDGERVRHENLVEHKAQSMEWPALRSGWRGFRLAMTGSYQQTDGYKRRFVWLLMFEWNRRERERTCRTDVGVIVVAGVILSRWWWDEHSGSSASDDRVAEQSGSNVDENQLIDSSAQTLGDRNEWNDRCGVSSWLKRWMKANRFVGTLPIDSLSPLACSRFTSAQGLRWHAMSCAPASGSSAQPVCVNVVNGGNSSINDCWMSDPTTMIIDDNDSWLQAQHVGQHNLLCDPSYLV